MAKHFKTMEDTSINNLKVMVIETVQLDPKKEG